MARMTTTAPPVAVIALTAAGGVIAARICRALPGASLHGRAGRIAKADVHFAEATTHIRALFAKGVPVVGICAAGILIRAVAPLVKDKQVEPPLIAVGSDGKTVVPLLGGHHGANRLAARIARELKTSAAVTTAGDTVLGIALDEPPDGWRVANAAAAKSVAAALLAGKTVAVEADEGFAAPWLDALRKAAGKPKGRAAGRVRVTASVPARQALTIHPPVLAVGIGCERGTEPKEVNALVRRTLAKAGLAPQAVACVVSLDLKADEPAVQSAADTLGVSVRYFFPAELEEQTPRLAHPSEIVFQATGTHGVAEAAALAAVGRQGRLLVPKTKSKRATCAVAWSPVPLECARIGRPRGSLRVVGIGPGDADWRTPEASRAIAEATDLVGYKLYIDLLGAAARGKVHHDSALGAEERRVRLALDLAAQGRAVALVCSGDAGVYGLATLVLELMEREARPDWNRLDLAVVPGLSALLAAAARAGAPLGHDFCVISLSDLLTPWADIERRVKAAVAGDFVVALYNPASERRRDHLAAVRDLILAARAPGTPVVIARNLGRAGEAVAITTLAQFDLARVDMLTLVLIGNSTTRIAAHGGRTWVHTPRGYADKDRSP
jgi:cobalt-precorrin 5A hydrolase/precorrin-3B C17-methyltransferase